jgi:DNA-binding CsgD family transcriptional regulator
MSELLAIPGEVDLALLSAKDREVLDLLARHYTTKEIARELQLNPNTVDKRLAGIRTKLGTADRYETARRYLELMVGGGNSSPQFPCLDSFTNSEQQLVSDLPKSAEFRLSDVLTFERHWKTEPLAPAGLEALDKRFGKVWRVAAIPVLALFVAMVLLCGLAVAKALTDVL